MSALKQTSDCRVLMSALPPKDGVIGRRLVDSWKFWVLRFRLMVKRGHRCTGPKHQKEKRSMDHFAGLDVSVKETSVCIVDDTGKIVREVKVASEPTALLAVLKNPAYHFKRIGLEAGPLSQWLCSAVAEAELPVVCVETRHMQAVLKAQINKTDRNDARGIAQMMRVGLYRPVHVKTLRSQKLRMLLTHRKLLQSKAIAIDNDLRGTLRNFGLKVGTVGKAKFEARIKELVENLPDLAILIEPLLIVRRALREQVVILHRHLLAIVRDDAVCRRLMTTPGLRRQGAASSHGVEVVREGRVEPFLHTHPMQSSAAADWAGLALEEYFVPSCVIPRHEHVEHFVHVVLHGSVKYEVLTRGKTLQFTANPGTTFVLPWGPRRHQMDGADAPHRCGDLSEPVRQCPR